MAAGAAVWGTGIKEIHADTGGLEWAGTADVLVIGSGVGGCASALAAHEAGANVTVLEKAPMNLFGGNSAVSGGNFFALPPEEYLKTLLKLSGGRSEPAAAAALADHAESSIRWLNQAGVRMNWSKRSGYAVAPDRGKGAMADLLQILRNKGIDIQFESKAERLLQDDQRRVIGVRAAVNSRFVNFKAKRAVILATGGYLANQEMTVKYMGPQATAIEDLGLPHITGDGHRMALELGAALLNMGDCRLAPGIPGSNLFLNNWYPHGIIVNKESLRFVDEAGAAKGFLHLGREIFRQTDGVGYVILDEKWKTRVPTSSQRQFAGRGGKLTEADTLEQLAEEIGLSPISLKYTVAQFNAAVSDGTALNIYPPKTEDAVKLDEPKFYAAKLVNASTVSFGGVRINQKAQVLNLESTPIPRLYATGILVGGIYYQHYKSGCGLASGVAFGRLAGRYAALENLLE